MVSDGAEALLGTNPNNPEDDMNPLRDDDTDGDGLTDREEMQPDGVVDTNETDPNRFDTDGDGIGDGTGTRAGYDPLNVDSDGDGVADGNEDKNFNGRRCW